MLADRSSAVLVVVDLQEGFRPVIEDFDEVVRSAGIVIRGCRLLDVPILVTEQYPRGLGPTVDELAQHLDGCPRVAKTAFAAPAAQGFDLGGRDQVLICGIEAHICVYQSTAALLEQGLAVQVIEDAVGARTAANRALGLDRMAELGAQRSGVEMCLFELLGDAQSPQFKEIQQLII